MPFLFIPDVPLTWETLRTIAPFSLAMAVVGLLESLLTAKLVDDITDTRSNKTRESWAQGAANIVSGFLGGMGGCAVVGQTMMNVRASGARTRISTFCAGVLLLVLVVLLGDVVAVVPMAVLVAIMIFVSWATFDWHSIRPSTLRRMPKSETTVMLVTVVATVWTHNLAIGVVLGVLVAMVAFARRVAHFVTVKRELVDEAAGGGEGSAGGSDERADDAGAVARYTVEGELFFASSNDLFTQFHYAEDPDRIVIDMYRSHVWDASTVAAIDSVTEKYTSYGKTVEVRGLNEASQRMRQRLSGTLGG